MIHQGRTHSFILAIGDVVSDGVPGPGAGRIESPGVLDVYAFDAVAGQEVFFDLQAGSAGSNSLWILRDPNGDTVFRQNLNRDAGTYRLDLGGTYTLTVGDPTEDYTGTYQIQLWNVPAPDTFTIGIGDVVSEGVPGPGAGSIETPGVRDVYAFAGTSGQTVVFDLQGGSVNSRTRWMLADPDGAVIFDRLLNSDQGPFTLDLTGTYQLTIGDPDDDDTGTYQFQIVSQP